MRYQKLVELKLYHKYYETHSTRDFDIQPGYASKDLMSRLGLTFRQISRGFEIYGKEEKRPLLEEEQAIRLSMAFYSVNPYLQNFSNLNPYNLSLKYFFNNMDKSISSSEKEILHQSEFVSDDQLCRCFYPETLLKDFWEETEVVINRGDETVFEDKLEDWHRARSILGEAFGEYEILMSGTGDSQRFRYCQPEFSRALAIVDLELGNINKTSGMSYEILINNRPIIWNYFFVTKVISTIESLSVFLGKEQLGFTSPHQTELANGQLAYKISSEKEMPVKHRYNGDRLYAEINLPEAGSSTTLIKKKILLPKPDVKRIKSTHGNGKEQFYTDIYVYI